MLVLCGGAQCADQEGPVDHLDGRLEAEERLAAGMQWERMPECRVRGTSGGHARPHFCAG